MKHGWGIYLTNARERGVFYATLHGNGVVYEVGIPDGLYINWDQPLSRQPEAKQAIRNALPSKHPENSGSISIQDQFDILVQHGWCGLDGYKHLAKLIGNKKGASLALRREGVTGITYLGFDDWDGKGVRGYVVFDPSKLRILDASHVHK